MNDGKSVLGLSPSMAAVLAYAGLFVSGILILAFERDNKFVRFHAMQSTVLFLLMLVASAVITWLFGWIFLIGGLIDLLLSSIFIGVWLFLMYKAYTGEEYKMPIIGDVAWKQINK